MLKEANMTMKILAKSTIKKKHFFPEKVQSHFPLLVACINLTAWCNRAQLQTNRKSSGFWQSPFMWLATISLKGRYHIAPSYLPCWATEQSNTSSNKLDFRQQTMLRNVGLIILLMLFSFLIQPQHLLLHFYKNAALKKAWEKTASSNFRVSTWDDFVTCCNKFDTWHIYRHLHHCFIPSIYTHARPHTRARTGLLWFTKPLLNGASPYAFCSNGRTEAAYSCHHWSR